MLTEKKVTVPLVAEVVTHTQDPDAIDAFAMVAEVPVVVLVIVSPFTCVVVVLALLEPLIIEYVTLGDDPPTTAYTLEIVSAVGV